jgi:hypothetical protein
MYRQNDKRTKPYHTYLYHREEGCIAKMLKELNLTTHIYTTGSDLASGTFTLLLLNRDCLVTIFAEMQLSNFFGLICLFPSFLVMKSEEGIAGICPSATL